MFLHEAVKEGLQSGDTVIPTPLFREKYAELCVLDPAHGKTKINKQFEVSLLWSLFSINSHGIYSLLLHFQIG